ncbi:MSMEG_0567/Sll0786 family nitrogen starvation N-acetyltransferase [Acidocella facilis]|uniref:MSMEG_0567/Sll0786 family nitrogen starvation N-acetyltransferase n=1 Tax=Acidocella facilis TaxID=525 RepID=UPI001F36E266|nr:MSMEG_0567/Sll0786 family nitrogen starvation N-acetyltransferase [Acidocella facilis]
MFEPFRAFLPSEYQVKAATEGWEFRAAARLRRQVFCAEQGIFQQHDRDALDDVALPLVAVSLLGVAAGEVAGTVRIHEAEPGLWWGSRLAVAPEFRRAGALGAALIRLAVGSAHGRGAKRFLAHVQAQNVKMFQRLHWHTLEEMELHGRNHALMQADLAAYPAIRDPALGFRALARQAA